jgi:hypothetical protein
MPESTASVIPGGMEMDGKRTGVAASTRAMPATVDHGGQGDDGRYVAYIVADFLDAIMGHEREYCSPGARGSQLSPPTSFCHVMFARLGDLRHPLQASEPQLYMFPLGSISLALSPLESMFSVLIRGPLAALSVSCLKLRSQPVFN